MAKKNVQMCPPAMLRLLLPTDTNLCKPAISFSYFPSVAISNYVPPKHAHSIRLLQRVLQGFIIFLLSLW